MVTAVKFAVRDVVGGVQAGSVIGPGEGNFIQVGTGDSISLNLSASSIVSYVRQGSDLAITLSDGRVIVLSGYFSAPGAQLYLSSNDDITLVTLSDDGSGLLMANYAPVQGADKWSPLDSLRFSEPDLVMADAVPTDEPAGMGIFAPAAMAGGLGAGALGLGLIGIGGGGGRGGDTTDGGGGDDTTGGGGDDTTGGGGGDDTTGGGGGGDDTTGGGGGGDDTTGGGGGGDDTTGGGGGDDTTGGGGGDDTTGGGGGNGTVVVSVTEGTKTSGHVENIEEFKDGVTIGGTSTPGASIKVVIDGTQQTTTAGGDGTWSVTFPPGTVSGGEREPAVTVTATGECQTFCVSVIWSMLPERSEDYDDIERTAGRVAEGLQAA